ncbi:MAG TPA: CHASE3 domain-containing protein [Croceibacterium sp.]|nr:CHASE3 domain-containing protein [Croceibacterium sp.]
MTGQMWRGSGRWLSVAAFAVVAAALLGSVALIYNTIESERRARAQVQVTREILEQLRDVNRAAVNAETGQRGYFITLDRRYLGPYLASREIYRPALDRLAALTRNSPPRVQQLQAETARLVEAKFAEIDQVVEQIERGELIAAQQRILTDEGQEVMDRLRRSGRDWEQLENNLLERELMASETAEKRVIPLLAGLLVLLLAALYLGFRQIARAAHAEAQAAQAEELAEAHDRADLLARELNHRVKNLFTMILAIVRMSGRDTPAAKPVLERIDSRIRALLNAHEVTQGTLAHPVADLRALVETSLSPYRGEDAECTIDGPKVLLTARQVTPLGLVLHELTTNAVKYGAWAHRGRIDVIWRVVDGRVRIDWSEHCAVPVTQATGEGFGSLLMEGASRQIDGSIERSIGAEGVEVKIDLALENA